MLIKVTRENIKNGKPYDSRRCALALAFKDAGFKVCIGSIIYEDSKSKVRITKHTKRSRAFILAFDMREPVEPIAFWFKEFA